MQILHEKQLYKMSFSSTNGEQANNGGLIFNSTIIIIIIIIKGRTGRQWLTNIWFPRRQPMSKMLMQINKYTNKSWLCAILFYDHLNSVTTTILWLIFVFGEAKPCRKTDYVMIIWERSVTNKWQFNSPPPPPMVQQPPREPGSPHYQGFTIKLSLTHHTL